MVVQDTKPNGKSVAGRTNLFEGRCALPGMIRNGHYLGETQPEE